MPDAAVISRVLKAAVAHTVQLPPNMNAMGFTVPDSVVVHVIEDDQPSRIAASRLLKQAGYAVRAYSSGAEFLADMPEEGGCIVLDFQLPGSNGLELQEHREEGQVA